MDNLTLMQFFHWYIRPEDKLWLQAGEQADFLSQLGITHIWLPPAYKSASGLDEPGYAVYDLYDLGEFDQKNTIRTKYGTRAELIAAINTLHEKGIAVLADIVLNHRHGADEQEDVPVQPVQGTDRNKMKGEPEIKKIWSRFTFPGRKGEYSDYVWDWHSFTGTCEDNENIYLIKNEYTDKGWEEMLDDENGNYDYLMGLDIEFRNPYVREELTKWGKWFINATQADGFRLDALKHIHFGFYKEWLDAMKEYMKKDFLCIGEYWRNDVGVLQNYIKATEDRINLFDVPLHYNFHEASNKGDQYDLRTILDNTLLQSNPYRAVTFVDNHDTQPMQSLESSVEEWFKPLAYALILLRHQGLPCVFYPALYGAKYMGYHEHGATEITMSPVPGLPLMIRVRKDFCYGEQHNYFDNPNCIGWTYSGADDKPGSGCAVLISNGGENRKKMEIGKKHAGAVYKNIMEENVKLVIDGEGYADFYVKERSISVWIKDEALIN